MLRPRSPNRRRHKRHLGAVGTAKQEASIVSWFDGEATFVKQTMVAPTKLDEVVELGFASICPMLDVVTVDPAVVGATGEAATAVAVSKRPAD